MPSNQTTNYGLSQWVKSDQVKMEDFNADNAKIDGALKAEADARTAADTALSAALSKCGNCRIWTTSYTGDGQYGESRPNRLEFPWTPSVVLVNSYDGLLLSMFYGAKTGMFHASSSGFSYLTWTEQGVQWYSNNSTSQMNSAGKLYLVAAFGVM